MGERAVPLLVRLRGALESLPPTQRRVAEQVLADPDRAARATVEELAAGAATSTASVVRLSRRMDYARVRDLQLDLTGGHGAGEHRYAGLGTDIEPGDPLTTVVQKIARAEQASLADTAVVLDVAALERAVEAVVRARRVDVFGVGASALAALDLHQKLTRIGRTAMLWTDAHMAWTSATTLDHEVVACAVSHSGSTTDAVTYLRQARAAGATGVAITSAPGSALAREADVVLLTAAHETEYRAGAMGSRIAQLMVVDCLFTGVARHTHAESVRLLAATYDAVGPRRLR